MDTCCYGQRKMTMDRVCRISRGSRRRLAGRAAGTVGGVEATAACATDYGNAGDITEIEEDVEAIPPTRKAVTTLADGSYFAQLASMCWLLYQGDDTG